MTAKECTKKCDARAELLFSPSKPIACFHSRDQHLCKFIGTKEIICIRKEFNSHRTGLGHQHGRRFIGLGHQYGRRDVMRKHSIVFVPFSLTSPLSLRKLPNNASLTSYVRLFLESVQKQYLSLAYKQHPVDSGIGALYMPLIEWLNSECLK